MKGWIAIHRRIIDNWIWSEAIYLKRWLDLLFCAAWEPTVWRSGSTKIRIERGQIVTSVRRLIHRWGANGRFITEFLDILEDENMIRREKVQKLTVITIVNYDKYQCVIIPPEDPESREERLRSWSQSWQQNKQENNINKLNNHQPSLSCEEENLKFYEELKKSDSAFEQAAMSLGCTKQELLELLDKFMGEQNFKQTKHRDSSDFRNHFFDWARYQVRNKRNDERRKEQNNQDGGADKYERRRGTDVGNHTSADYGGSF